MHADKVQVAVLEIGERISRCIAITLPNLKLNVRDKMLNVQVELEPLPSTSILITSTPWRAKVCQSNM